MKAHASYVVHKNSINMIIQHKKTSVLIGNNYLSLITDYGTMIIDQNVTNSYE